MLQWKQRARMAKLICVPGPGLTAPAHHRLPFILSAMVWLRMWGTLARSHQHVGPYGTHSAQSGSHFAVTYRPISMAAMGSVSDHVLSCGELWIKLGWMDFLPQSVVSSAITLLSCGEKGSWVFTRTAAWKETWQERTWTMHVKYTCHRTSKNRQRLLTIGHVTQYHRKQHNIYI